MPQKSNTSDKTLNEDILKELKNINSQLLNLNNKIEESNLLARESKSNEDATRYTDQNGKVHFQNIHDLPKNAMFMKQQIEYEKSRKSQKHELQNSNICNINTVLQQLLDCDLRICMMHKLSINLRLINEKKVETQSYLTVFRISDTKYDIDTIYLLRAGIE
ncbi:Hypothetical predicted protein [Octopus vulgaris]|uniref:Uncharacterized protein n=1 Tax=Octopus vulgaris TaxID=6645 RepID=A0AA36F9T6_OCTVU|nr:Hypothetical predicted protein [Octopus vulgaris]